LGKRNTTPVLYAYRERALMALLKMLSAEPWPIGLQDDITHTGMNTNRREERKGGTGDWLK